MNKYGTNKDGLIITYANIENGKCDCLKCAGTGYLENYNMIENGICFKCDGTGRQDLPQRTYTLEEAEIKSKRIRDLEKLNRENNIIKMNAKDKIETGFKNDSLYIIFCEYGDKEQVKNLGAKWNSKLQYWTIENEINDFDTLLIRWEDITEVKEVWADVEIKRSMFDYSKFRKIVNNYKESKKKYKGEWIGKEKDKIQLKVILTKIKDYKTNYGWTNVYIFKDENGNILTWNTAKDMEEWKEGKVLEIKATIKAHEKFEDEKENIVQKQTSILRVKEI